MKKHLISALSIVLSPLLLIACEKQSADSDGQAAVAAQPLADDENIKRMQPREGLWQRAISGPSEFALHI